MNETMAIFSSAFMLGLVSNFHCLGMCGPLTVSLGKNPARHVLYQTGRLISYQLMGFTIYLLSEQILQNLAPSIKEYALIFIVVLYCFIGLFLIFKVTKPKLVTKLLGNSYKSLYARFIKSSSKSSFPFFLGLISALLPCGLLHTFLVGTIPLAKPWIVFTYIFSFWLATCPVLVVFAISLKKLYQQSRFKTDLVSGVLYICLGIYLLYHRYPAIAGAIRSTHDCH